MVTATRTLARYRARPADGNLSRPDATASGDLCNLPSASSDKVLDPALLSAVPRIVGGPETAGPRGRLAADNGMDTAPHAQHDGRGVHASARPYRRTRTIPDS
jgi:hypothetical protein